MRDGTGVENLVASAPARGDNLDQLRAARDAALLVAQTAIRDTTRLTRLLTILSEPAPLEQLLDRVLATLSEIFAADIVVLLDPAGNGSFAPLAAIGLPEDIIAEPFSNAKGSYTAATMSSQAPILLEEMEADPLVDLQLRDLGAKTGVWLPVIGNYSARGALIMARCTPLPFVHHDVGLLSAMIYRIGLSLEQAQRSSQLELIVHLGREIGRHLDMARVCSRAAAMFPAVVAADSAALFLTNMAGKPECAAETGFHPDWIPAWISLTELLLTAIGFNLRPYSTPDLFQDAIATGIALPQNCPVAALVAVPILYDGLVQGMLYGMRNSTIPFNPDTLQVAMLYAGQISAAMENARLYRAVHDELSERKQAEQALRASDNRFRALIRSVSDVISILTAEGQITYISPAVETAWDCSAQRLLAHSILDCLHPDDREPIQNLLSELQAQPNATLTQTARIRHGDKDWRIFDVILTNLLEEPAVAGIVATYHDITERKTYEQELRKLAFRDPLTGLSNRANFRDILNEALVRANAQNRSVAVLFLDLDNFKIVNDRLGHAWGDHLLQLVAERLQACLRISDAAARLGGDEFTILIDGITGIDQVLAITQRLINSLQGPLRLKDCDVSICGSFGIAISTPNQDTADGLLHKADLAMYVAKSQGKGGYAIFDPAMTAASVGWFEND